MSHQIYHYNIYTLPTQGIYVFYTDLRTHNDYFRVHKQEIDFYNQGRMCLLRGTS